MKFIKEIIKYILIFIFVVLFLTAILVLIAKIPRKYVERNLQKATIYFEKNKDEITRIQRKREYTYLHPFADEMILNIIYCLDTNQPFEAVLEARFYTEDEKNGSNQKFIDLIERNLESNEQYIRYWHGSIVIIKPLLIIFTLEQIYILNAIVLIILSVILFALLIIKKYYSLFISLLIGLIMTAVWYVPFTFEYYWTFAIMLITSIITILIEFKNRENKNNKLFVLFFIVGILTCFFDFLTTETITILVPIIIVLSIRMKKQKFENFKNEFLFVLKSLILWFIAYSFMWLAKWGMASIVLKINVMEYVFDKAMYRINGRVMLYSRFELMKHAIKRNFTTIFPINLIKRKKNILQIIYILLLVIPAIITDKKNKEKMKYMVLLIMLGIIPYIRYILLSNHSYCHNFMTFRSQISTIMCYALILINCSNIKNLATKLKKKGNKVWKKLN